MIKFAIFNMTSGRYLADYETGGYLIFSDTLLAKLYIQKKNLNPEHFKVRRMVKNESD